MRVLFLPACALVVFFWSASAPAQVVYWTESSGTITRSNGDGTNVQPIASGLNSPRGLAIDEINQKLYWVETDALKRADLDGSNVETLLDDTELLGTFLGGGLGLDVEDDRIFVGYGGGTIGVTDLAGSFFNSFFTGGADGIEVDVVANKIYFAQTDDIDRINYDGTNQESVIFASLLGFDAHDCDIDFTTGKIYMADNEPTEFGIWRANLDETEVEPISSAFIEKADIDVAGGKIYWTDDVDGKVLRANLDGTNVETLHTGLTFPRGIVVLPAGPQEPVPTVSEWGLATMTLLVLAVGTIAIRRGRFVAA